jgi:hypothetical protein
MYGTISALFSMFVYEKKSVDKLLHLHSQVTYYYCDVSPAEKQKKNEEKIELLYAEYKSRFFHYQ